MCQKASNLALCCVVCLSCTFFYFSSLANECWGEKAGGEEGRGGALEIFHHEKAKLPQLLHGSTVQKQ